MKRFLSGVALLLAIGLGLSIVSAFQTDEKQRGSSNTFQVMAQDPSSDSITEISLEYRAGGWGSSSYYQVVLRKNGTATYDGIGLMQLQGKYKGEIEQEDFQRLAEFFVEERFFELPDYDAKAPRLSHSEIIIISVVRRGERKTVGDVNKQGPPKMAAFEMMINRALKKNRVGRRHTVALLLCSKQIIIASRLFHWLKAKIASFDNKGAK